MHTDAHNAMMHSSMMDRGDTWMCPDELGNDLTQRRRQRSEFHPPSRENRTELTGFLSFSSLLEVFKHWSVEHLLLSCIYKLTSRWSTSSETSSSLGSLETRITSVIFIRLITDNPMIKSSNLKLTKFTHPIASTCLYFYLFIYFFFSIT